MIGAASPYYVLTAGILMGSDEEGRILSILPIRRFIGSDPSGSSFYLFPILPNQSPASMDGWDFNQS